MKTYIDVSTFPLTLSLRENFDLIKDEFLSLRAAHQADKPNNVMGARQKQNNGKILYQGQFKTVFTRVVAESCSISELRAAFGDKDGIITAESKRQAQQRYEARQKTTPALERCLAPFVDNIGSVGFNTIYPGAKLSKHYGMCDDYIRFHMGIECDPGAVFLVEDLTPRAWVDREVFAFDDGRAFHGTEHNGEAPRTILIVDVHRRAFSEMKEDTWR